MLPVEVSVDEGGRVSKFDVIISWGALPPESQARSTMLLNLLAAKGYSFPRVLGIGVIIGEPQPVVIMPRGIHPPLPLIREWARTPFAPMDFSRASQTTQAV
ncbi:MAG: hypothetical protein A3B37_00880 [Candidatus Sungbacteria bacterium RIFCSPLOWO2_01_FULL_59_16]|uniref:Uncharacterized protein n=1 Tax=Candidatus Sungbacteria bacterium RIFCSPLOWO2_01_FULL_59_16 TaxID=1802280 RepID=A0A1G2LE51_9BACT|nr:MAG: hypothetical protein A3B37_00880 [Candidatus Sungbacteria bacterium RIFCSPLOWO2_01_FULL_59_16]